MLVTAFKQFSLLQIIFLLAIAVFFLSCSNSEETCSDKQIEEFFLFTKMDAAATGISFSNHVQNQKDLNIFKYRNFYNGAGVGIGDINNDGLPDVYLTSNMGRNKLYLNKGNFKFEDITKISGTAGNRPWSTGVTMVDINADGFLDIYVSNAGDIEGYDRSNELFINNGDLTFTEAAKEYHLDENGFTTHAAFFDYDGDGDLDAYILNNSFIPASSLGYKNKRELRSENWDLPEVFKGGGDKLLKNNNGIFEDVSEEAGIYGSLIGFGLGVTVGDINNDFLPDIYVSNDFYERDYLYINQGDGTFKEEIKNYISHLSLSSMGADMADINNDGYPEIFVTDMLPENDERLKNTSEFERYDFYKRKVNNDFHHQYMQNTLQLNNGDNSFSEIAFYSGVAQTDWSWGALIFDMDNDGYKDIYVSNGIYHDLTDQDFMDFFANEFLQEMVLMGKKKEFDSILNKMPSTPIPNYAFKNNRDLSFSNVSEKWGFSDPGFSNGAAYGDLDNDGDLDLIVNNVNQELFVYRNNAEKKTTNNYLKIQLKGSGKNPFGVGSKVRLHMGEKVITQELIPTRGFQSSIAYELVFGIGESKKVDSLQVIWPNQRTQTKVDIEANQVLVLNQTDATKQYMVPLISKQKLLTPLDLDLPPHKENNYVDFDYEVLIYKMLSREGPALAVADINSDGNNDLFLGGAQGTSAHLFLNKGNGTFKEISEEIFIKDANYEDTAAAFADINGDGLPDLVVSSGGNNRYAEKDLFKTRIYLNEGKGKFSASEEKIPSTGHNAAVVAPFDYDQDGDIDLFIGARSVPGIYGINPHHQLLENDGSGNFSDVTEAIAYELTQVGMITKAVWTDMDGDNRKDLVVVGDWISPKIFLNKEDGLLPYKTTLDDLTGSWTGLSAEDLNGDGKMDLILGNRGTNSFYNPKEDEPVKMYVNDFDNNGTIEQILTRPINGRDIPVALRRELSGQIASVKKQNLKFADYATKSVNELFPKEILENSMVHEISTFKSIIAYNNGDGTFKIEVLPAEVQFSSIYAIATLDAKKGTKDILMAGNNFDLKPQFSRMDANQGILLTQNSEGKYVVKKSAESGFKVKGQVRDLQVFINKNGKKYIVAAINDQSPKIFMLDEENY